MATFQAQVQSLSGLTISSSGTNPTEAELTQFLKDGVIDVTNRVTILRPQDIENFQRESATIDSNSGLDVGGAKIISVIREAGADGSSDGSTAWELCQKIPASMQSRVVDINSLHYASQYHPKYLIDDNGKVNVYPVASANNGYKVFFVNNVPTDATNETSLVYSDSDIKWFPNDKVHLVVLYASIKSLQSAMSSLHGNSGISAAIALIKTAVDQAATAADKFLSATGSVFGDEDTFDTAASQLTRVKDALNNAEKIIDDGANSPTGNASGDAATYLYTEEDTELVQGALGIAAAEINRAQAHLAEWTGIGGMRVKEIQSALQEAEGYAKEVQIRMADLAQEYQWYNARYMALKAEYDQSFAIMAPPQQQAQPQRRARA